MQSVLDVVGWAIYWRFSPTLVSQPRIVHYPPMPSPIRPASNNPSPPKTTALRKPLITVSQAGVGGELTNAAWGGAWIGQPLPPEPKVRASGWP
jgi:hypothetical protein